MLSVLNHSAPLSLATYSSTGSDSHEGFLGEVDVGSVEPGGWIVIEVEVVALIKPPA